MQIANDEHIVEICDQCSKPALEELWSRSHTALSYWNDDWLQLLANLMKPHIQDFATVHIVLDDNSRPILFFRNEAHSGATYLACVIDNIGREHSRTRFFPMPPTTGENHGSPR
ncbi:MAG: hypothetical protein HQL45_17515 [Alphaproteobacteria bacterium]|nr:hypothetical protein [Alphaproteobacteria bacterium]